MEQASITLPQSLTTSNSKELLVQCKSYLHKGDLTLDGAHLKYMDYSADAFFALLNDLADKKGHQLTLKSFNPEIKEFLSGLKRQKVPHKDALPQNFVENLGEKGIAFVQEAIQVFTLLNMCIFWTLLGPFDKGRIRFGGITKQIFFLGSEATWICFLMVALICLTLALQSSMMLKAVGGGSFLASGLGFLIFAEIGPLITTIILAGRSGSSIAAEIANMSVCEEVKALKTMAIPPVQYLVVPRFIAMSICTPILSFCASIFGCFAGFLIAFFFFDITFNNYFNSIREGIAPLIFLKSSIKALVFGWIITLISCNKGLRATGGAEAVGKATTSSVVASISTIIIADTLFASIFY